MAWVIDLIPISKGKFKNLKAKLILSYLSVMITIFWEHPIFADTLYL